MEENTNKKKRKKKEVLLEDNLEVYPFSESETIQLDSETEDNQIPEIPKNDENQNIVRTENGNVLIKRIYAQRPTIVEKPKSFMYIEKY